MSSCLEAKALEVVGEIEQQELLTIATTTTTSNKEVNPQEAIEMEQQQLPAEPDVALEVVNQEIDKTIEVPTKVDSTVHVEGAVAVLPLASSTEEVKPQEEIQMSEQQPVEPVEDAALIQSTKKTTEEPTKIDTKLHEAGYTHLQGAIAPPPLAPPPFTIQELRAVIPPHCFERSLVRSMYYVIENVALCGITWYIGTYIDYLPAFFGLILWPVYWYFQGLFLTGIWVLGHECGHHSFSEYPVLNDGLGIILHSAVLIPYYSFKITHRRHHNHTGHRDHEEVFVPPSKSKYMSNWIHYFDDSVVFNFLLLLIALPFGWVNYLLNNASGPTKYHIKNVPNSHFNPYSALFTNEADRKLVIQSNYYVGTAIFIYFTLGLMTSLTALVNYYVIPFLVMDAFVVGMTMINHTDTYIPWFRGEEWSWIRGALCSVDRWSGSFTDHMLHSMPQVHVCHHLFPKIPFYHAAEATQAMKPLLGEYHLFDPTPPMEAIWRAMRHCKFLEDDSDVAFYKTKTSSTTTPAQKTLSN